MTDKKVKYASVVPTNTSSPEEAYLLLDNSNRRVLLETRLDALAAIHAIKSHYNIQQHELFKTWISVEERRPEPYTLFLDASPLGNEIVCNNLGFITKDGYFFDVVRIKNSKNSIFTHWMPIPKEPNNEQ